MGEEEEEEYNKKRRDIRRRIYRRRRQTNGGLLGAGGERVHRSPFYFLPFFSPRDSLWASSFCPLYLSFT